MLKIGKVGNFWKEIHYWQRNGKEEVARLSCDRSLNTEIFWRFHFVQVRVQFLRRFSNCSPFFATFYLHDLCQGIGKIVFFGFSLILVFLRITLTIKISQANSFKNSKIGEMDPHLTLTRDNRLVFIIL